MKYQNAHILKNMSIWRDHVTVILYGYIKYINGIEDKYLVFSDLYRVIKTDSKSICMWESLILTHGGISRESHQ